MRNRRRQLTNESGTAFVETLIVIPVFAAILAGVLALNAMYSAKLEAKGRARQLAWLQAESGDCPAQSCIGGQCEAPKAEIRGGGLDALQSARSSGFSLGSFVGDLGQFLAGKVTHGVAFISAPLPALLDAAATTQQGRTTLVCNTTSRRAEQASSAFDQACSAGLDQTEYAREVCK